MPARNPALRAAALRGGYFRAAREGHRAHPANRRAPGRQRRGPRLLDPIQTQLASILRAFLQMPGFNRKEIAAAMRVVNVPQPRVYLKTMRKALEAYQKDGLGLKFLQELTAIGESTAAIEEKQKVERLKREDLKLICFDYVWE